MVLRSYAVLLFLSSFVILKKRTSNCYKLFSFLTTVLLYYNSKLVVLTLHFELLSASSGTSTALLLNVEIPVNIPARQKRFTITWVIFSLGVNLRLRCTCVLVFLLLLLLSSEVLRLSHVCLSSKSCATWYIRLRTEIWMRKQAYRFF